MDDIKIRIEKALENLILNQKEKIREIEQKVCILIFGKIIKQLLPRWRNYLRFSRSTEAETLSEFAKTGELDKAENILNEFEYCFTFPVLRFFICNFGVHSVRRSWGDGLDKYAVSNVLKIFEKRLELPNAWRNSGEEAAKKYHYWGSGDYAYGF